METTELLELQDRRDQLELQGLTVMTEPLVQLVLKVQLVHKETLVHKVQQGLQVQTVMTEQLVQQVQLVHKVQQGLMEKTVQE
jgi:hypothetical protein